MTNISVAIVKSDFHDKHSTSWGAIWLEYCEGNQIEHELIDWRALNAFDALVNHDVVLWHYSHYSEQEMKFAAGLLQALKAAGCRVFPDFADSYHFDDKVIQSYMFKALGLNSPANYPLHGQEAINDWIAQIGKFPVVGKLRTGSGANNVQLIHDEQQLRSYGKAMFGAGLKSTPSLVFKASSNLSSTRTVAEFIARIKRAPEFYFSRKNASSRALEQGYVYLQEFIPNIDYDLKVVVVGNKLSFVGRRTRDGDFRASGSGALFYERGYIDEALIDLAFTAADAMGSDCTGLDIVIDPRNNEPVILEVSYGFSHLAQLGLNGHFDRSGSWIDEPLNAPRHLIERLCSETLLNKRKLKNQTS